MIQASTTTNGTTADPTALATDALLTAIMGRVHQYFWFAYGVVILLDVLLVWAHLPEIAVGITAVFTYALHLLYKTAISQTPSGRRSPRFAPSWFVWWPPMCSSV